MAIGNCDCCDRLNVPGSVVDCPGEPFACFICQGDIPDPYGEIDPPEIDDVTTSINVRDCDRIALPEIGRRI
jgi:hypothetical protein